MKESVSVHHLIICTGLKILNPMSLSIKIMVHFAFNEWMEFREQNQQDVNGIGSLMQCVKFLKYKKSTIDHVIYIKIFSDGTFSYVTVSTDDVLNTTNR